MEKYNLIIILGPTASGKTKLAVQVAHALQTEIISADSRQVYQNMDIGTGKDLADYEVDGQQIPYHLIDILPAGARYHVDAFKKDFYQAFEHITKKNKIPILCGGSGMYIHSLLQNQAYTSIPVNTALRQDLESWDKADLVAHLVNFNPQHVNHVDLSSKKRLIRAIEVAVFLKNNLLPKQNWPDLNPIVFGLIAEKSIINAKIKDRLNKRLINGLIEEVETLLKNGTTIEELTYFGLEYKFVTQYIVGQITFAELESTLYTAICQFSKRQITFFKKMEKDNVTINWLNADEDLINLKNSILSKI